MTRSGNAASLRAASFPSNAFCTAGSEVRFGSKANAIVRVSSDTRALPWSTPDIDSAAESMRQTEKAVSELQHLTGLADELQEPPAILELS